MIESDRNYVRLTVGRDAYTTRSTLQHAEESLKSQPMLRVSRSCLVNLNHVREISRTPRGDVIVILAGGATVTSSERFRDSVRKQLRRMQISPAGIIAGDGNVDGPVALGKRLCVRGEAGSHAFEVGDALEVTWTP